MAIGTALVASALIGASASAGVQISQARQQKKALEEQKRQYNETRDAENAEKRAQLQKQKDINAKYQGMTTNLYSGDVNGISTNKLVQ